MVEIAMLKNILIKFLIPIIVILLIVGVALYSFSSLLDLSPGSSKGGVSTGFASSVDMSQLWFADYTGVLYVEDSLETGQEVLDYLTQKDIVYDCEQCDNCNDDECDSCERCDDASGSFSNCSYCESGSCLACIDDSSESNICQKIKNCIKENLATNETCIIDELYPSPFTLMNPQELLSNCEEETLSYTTSEGVSRDICEFVPSIYTDHEEPYSVPGPYFCVGDLMNCDEVQSKASSSLFPTQTIRFPYKFPVYKISGLYEQDQTLGILILIKPGQISTTDIGNIISLPTASSQSENLCSEKELQKPGEWCVIGIAVCTDCANQVKSFSFDYSGELDTIVAIAFLPGSNINKFGVQLQLDQRYTIGLMYPTCGLEGQYTEDNAVYADDVEMFHMNPRNTNVKITLNNVEVEKQRECEFNMYVCADRAFANSTEDTVIDIYNYIRDFESPDLFTKISDTNYRMNPIAFDLDKNYTVEEITDAIKSGFSYWTKVNFMSTKLFMSATDRPRAFTDWTTSVMNTNLNWNNDCRDSSVGINYNCGLDNICQDQIKINVGFSWPSHSPGFGWLMPYLSFCEIS